MGGLEQLRLLYFPKISRPRGVFDVVAGERLTGVLHGKNLGSQPQGNLSFRQSFLGVDPPVPDAGVPRRVQDAGEPGREERPLQILRAMPDAREETQDLGRAPARVLAVLVRSVFLGVVPPYPAVVGGDESFPALGLREVVIRHPALNVEAG